MKIKTKQCIVFPNQNENIISLTPRPFADLTDVTLADEDSNSTPADDVNRAILGNVAMHVAPSGDQN